MKALNFLTLLSLFIALGFSSCKDDDDNPTPSSEIKLLTGKTALEIGESTVTYDGSTVVVKGFDFSEEDGEFFLIMVLKEDKSEYIVLSTSEQTVDGKTVIAQLEGKEYFGENFAVNSLSDTQSELTGMLSTDSGSSTKDIKILFDETSFGAGTSTITVSGNVAKLNGDLGSLTYNQILDLNANNRNVHTILFEQVPGSVNDEVNVETGRLIREAGYTTQVKSNSEIYSGGVDLFCAGKTRLIEEGAKIGVHSWCCGENGEHAADIPENDPQHNTQISYFTEMLGNPIGRDFYFFTINAAPFDGIHVMTKAEIEQYHLTTE